MKTRNAAHVLPILAVALLACGEDPAAPAPAEPCVIQDGNLVCPDGSSAKIPESKTCTITSEQDGKLILSCPDGSTAELPAESCEGSIGSDGVAKLTCPGGIEIEVPQGPGTTRLTGVVTLYGETDHSGITIELEGTDFTAVTDAAGALVIEEVPSGLYNVSASKQGFQAVRLENVLVYGIERSIRLELRRALLVQPATVVTIAQQASTLAVSRDAFAAMINGRPAIVRKGATEPVWIGSQAVNAFFSSDGKYLVAGTNLWDVKKGEQIQLAGGIQQSWFSASGERLAYTATKPTGERGFFVRKLPDGPEKEFRGLTPTRMFVHGEEFWFSAQSLNHELNVLRKDGDAPQVVGFNLGNSCNTLTFTSSKWAYCIQGTGALNRIDTETRDVGEPIHPDASKVVVSGDGKRVAFVALNGVTTRNEILVRDVDGTEKVVGDFAPTLFLQNRSISADDRYLIYSTGSFGQTNIFVWDWETEAELHVIENVSGADVEFVAGSRVLVNRLAAVSTVALPDGTETPLMTDATAGTQVGRWRLYSLESGSKPRTGVLDMQTLLPIDFDVRLAQPVFSQENDAIAALGLGENPTKIHIWSLPDLAHDEIEGAADSFFFAPGGNELILRQIVGDQDELRVYRRDRKVLQPLDSGSITILAVFDGEVVYLRTPGLSEDPRRPSGIWSAPLR